jgi:hypothetical protein
MAEQVVMMKRVVKVWDGEEPVEITVIQKSKTVWRATGIHMGKVIEVQGRSADNATALWRDAAHYKSN